MLPFLHSTGAVTELLPHWNLLLLVPDGGRWGTTKIQVLIGHFICLRCSLGYYLENFRVVWGTVSGYLALRWPFLVLTDIRPWRWTRHRSKKRHRLRSWTTTVSGFAISPATC